MTTTHDAALARLRNADPAAATPVDTVGTDPHALAMLTQNLGSAGDCSVAPSPAGPAAVACAV